MKHYGILLKNFVLVFLLLTLMGGCKKNELTGYEKIVGTATINGQNYKESTVWTWNNKGYSSPINFYKNYNLFHFIVQLSPEKSDNPFYNITFYVSEDEMQLKINHPYKIDFYKEPDVELPFYSDVILYFSENKSKILMEGAEGIVYVKSSDYEEYIPMKGEFIIESINSKTGVCYGSYSLSSSGNDSKKLEINGKFETMYFLNNTYF